MGGAEGERSRPEPGSGSGAGSGSGPDADEPDRPERPGEREEPGLADRADSVDALVRVVEEQRRAEARARIRFLEHGLIDQAVGVLVAQLSCGPDEAFGQLLELERRSGSGLLEIAGELVGRGVQGEPAGGGSSRDSGSGSAGGSGAAAVARVEPSRLDRARDADELARLLLADTLAWSGAVEVALALRGPDDALELIGSAGLSRRVAGQWQRIPPQMDCLLNVAVREQVPVWSDAPPPESGASDRSGRDRRERGGERSPGDGSPGSSQAHPGTGPGSGPRSGSGSEQRSSEPRHRPGPLLIGQPGHGGAPPNQLHVAVPMLFGRTLVGAIEVGWPASAAIPDDARREIAALLEATGQAVVRSRRMTDADQELGRDPGWEAGRDAAAEGGRMDRLREVMDAVWEPMLLVRATPDEHGPIGGLRIVAANRPAAEQLTPPGSAGSFPVVGRQLLELVPWSAASGAYEAFRTALAGGLPYQDPEHAYVEDAGPELGRRIRHMSVGATTVGEGLLLISLRPAAAAAGQWRARAARLRRLSGTGGWEWDVAAAQVHWSAEALTVLGSRAVPGPAPEDRPPYLVHRDDEPEHARLLRTLGRDGRPAQAEFRIIRPDSAVRYMRMAGEPVVGQDNAVTSVFGTVQDVTARRRAETALELAQIQLAAQRSRADSERQLADLLLQVIMPVEPARIPPEAGLEVAARYRPASAGAGVGGDWYGIIPLPDGRLLLTVGDIAGHGFTAATAMAQLYHALHGLALTGADSGPLLGWLNTLTCSLPTFTIASACCAIYDPAERRLSLANAGHPSPVLIRAGAAAALPKPGGTMLGVDPTGGYEEHCVDLETGDVLLLFTDGLIERRKHSPEDDIERLLAVAQNPEADLEAFVDRLLSEAQADTDDDTCVIAVRFG